MLVLFEFFLRWHILHAEHQKDSNPNHYTRRRLDYAFYVERLSDIEVLLFTKRFHRRKIPDWEPFPRSDVVLEIVD